MNRISDVIYHKKMGTALTLDVFRPDRSNGIGVIWIVSGGWHSAHENIDPAIADCFIREGQTVFAVVHASQPKFQLPEVIDDIHRAVRFIRTHAPEYGVDPARLGITGASAGGHLSLMMTAYGGPVETDAAGLPGAGVTVETASSRVQAAAVFFPPTDFLIYGAEGQLFPDHKPDPQQPQRMRDLMPHLFPWDQVTMDELRAVSPLYGVGARTPATMIIHGDRDGLVPLQQSERFAAAMETHQRTCRLDIREGHDHGWPDWPQEFALFAPWFQEHLDA